MTQLLISVKNLEEAQLALNAGVDIIDLKDPSVGALGALGLQETAHIVAFIDGLAIVSATAGEHHASLNELVQAIETRAEIGVDIIKIAVSSLFYDEQFIVEMAKLTIVGIKIVAVFFADTDLDLNLLEKLRKIGFYGAMLDTQGKQDDLLHVQSKGFLKEYVLRCEQNGLKSGLAGSLKSQYVETLAEINPTYIGFRGGVCENHIRTTTLSIKKVTDVKDMLFKHNNNRAKSTELLNLALHT